VSAGINETATAIEAFVRTFSALGVSPEDVQVRPSGDDVDVIKVWIDLGTATVDPQAWKHACEAAIKAAIPSSTAFAIAVRVEA